MQDAGRAMRARLGRFAEARPELVARLRLFGLLALLIVLFAGLQYMIGTGIPRVEVRFVSQDVPVFVPVERIVERIVERPVYVPVPVDATPEPVPASPTPPVQPGSTPTPSGTDPSGASAPSAGGPPGPAGVGAPGAVADGLTAVGALPAGPGRGVVAPGASAPSIPAGAPAMAPLGAPGLGSDISLEEVPDAKSSRGRVPPPVVIATEDRLGAPATVSSAPQVTVRVEREASRRNGNGNDNSSGGRSVRSSGGVQAVQPVSPAGGPAAPVSSDNSVGVAAGGAETPAKDSATPTPAKTPRASSATVQSLEAGRPRTSAIPAPVGVKPPPEE